MIIFMEILIDIALCSYCATIASGTSLGYFKSVTEMPGLSLSHTVQSSRALYTFCKFIIESWQLH